MEGVLPPLDSGKLIANNSKDVSIDNSGVSSVAHLVSYVFRVVIADVHPNLSKLILLHK